VVRELTFAISADYERATGGWVYNQRLLEGLARLGWRIHRLTLPAGFPHPSPAARAEAAAAFRGLANGTLVLVDQLCLGVLPEVAKAEAQRSRTRDHTPRAWPLRNRSARPCGTSPA